MHKEERINFGSHPPPDPGIFKRTLQHCDRAFFHNLAYIAGESDRIFMKISSQIYSLTRKSQLNILEVNWIRSLDIRIPDIDSGSRPYSAGLTVV